MPARDEELVGRQTWVEDTMVSADHQEERDTEPQGETSRHYKGSRERDRDKSITYRGSVGVDGVKETEDVHLLGP